MLGLFFVFLEVGRLQVRLIGSRIAIRLEKSNLFGMALYRDGKQGQSARLVVLLSFSALTSRIGGCPKNRLYSRLNWLTLS
jgi:hypothetical protein